MNGGLGLNHDQLFLRCDLGNDLDWLLKSASDFCFVPDKEQPGRLQLSRLNSAFCFRVQDGADEVWKLAQKAGRGFVHTEIISKQKSESIYLESIDSLEDTIRTTEAVLAEARDPENPRRGRFSL